MIYQLALYGHPVRHSQSPQIHQEFARQFGLAINYRLIDVSHDELKQKVRAFFAQGGHGANVTVPHKQQVMAVVDHLTDRARQAGAVNTLFIKNEQLWGDNTDGEGLLNDFKQKNITTENKRILIIGAGGAVQGILPGLLSTKPKAIYIHNRTRQKAEKLAKQSHLCHAFQDTQSIQLFDVIINGTSIGHQGQSPEIKPEWISPNTIVYDLSYGEAAEPFLKQSHSLGAENVYDGIGMLHHQAALSFYQWFKYMPTIKISSLQQRT